MGDIINIKHTLSIDTPAKLQCDVRNNDNKLVHLINPSVSENYIYFRVLEKFDWNWGKSYTSIAMLSKKTGILKIFDPPNELNKIEDLRIFDYNNKVWFVGYKRNNLTNIFETYIGWFNNDCTSIEKYQFKIAIQNQHIKNITPLINNNQLYFIDIYLGNIYKYIDDDSALEIIKLDITLINSLNIFGSTQYIHVKDSIYGALVHKSQKLGHVIYYVYYWIEVDIILNKVIYISVPFIVDKLSQIFITSIDKKSNNIIELMWGSHDKESYKCNTLLTAFYNLA
jgi:hypothetical protein